MMNVHQRIGGDSGLSPRGREFGYKLGKFLKEADKLEGNFSVWTSELKRTQETAQMAELEYTSWKG